MKEYCHTVFPVLDHPGNLFFNPTSTEGWFYYRVTNYNKGNTFLEQQELFLIIFNFVYYSYIISQKIHKPNSSWDSCGCESGIVLRDSAERDDASRNLDLLEAAVGGGELVIEPTNAITIRRTSSAADQPADGGTETAGTTPVQT